MTRNRFVKLMMAEGWDRNEVTHIVRALIQKSRAYAFPRRRR